MFILILFCTGMAAILVRYCRVNYFFYKILENLSSPVSSKIWSGQKLDRKKLVFLKNWFLFVCHFRFLKYFDNKLVFSFQFWLLSIFCFIIWVGLLKLRSFKGRSDLAGVFLILISCFLFWFYIIELTSPTVKYLRD